MIEIIIIQIAMLVFLLFLAGHDSSSIRLRDKFVDALTLKRINRWHRDGTTIYAMFCIAISYHISLFLLIPAILIRLAFFDPALNYWTDFNPGFIGTTAFWDKKFARIFGKNGAIKKAIPISISQRRNTTSNSSILLSS